jgi:holo-[acyl-carrier protein] synthase
MDMQEIEYLPLAHDYHAHEFYAAHFAPPEISTSILRPNPRAHLCGIFCAKEAAKKSHPMLLNVRMSDFIINHNAAGRPLLNLAASVITEINFQFLLSITHTQQFAAATCLTFWSND